MLKSECCTDIRCESGLRNNYYEGKRLTPEMFRVEQQYLLERRRLLNRAIHGWGVVYGYSIALMDQKTNRRDPATAPLKIGPGLALDSCGRELLQAVDSSVALDSVIFVDDDGHRVDPEKAMTVLGPPRSAKGPDRRICWLLSAHYAEQSSGSQNVPDSCGCERREWDQICETVRFSLRPIDCRDCCNSGGCELHCGCGAGPCCDSDSASPEQQTQEKDERYGLNPDRLPFKRGGCRCLCDHLIGLNPGGDCGGALCEIEEPCGRVRVDLGHGVPLACIELVLDDCDCWTFGEEIDVCGPRRLVKRNDLLFDLVRGCDLTRISAISWWPWHRAVNAIPFADFSAQFGAVGSQQDEYVTKFTVTFSRPVRKKTVGTDCFAITVFSGETEGGWLDPQRVPIVRIDTTPSSGDDQLVTDATLIVAGGWVEDGLRGRHSVFLADETWVEIEVRGDLILDCNGQPVDANSVGLTPAPTGNGTPGGTMLSTFRVEQARTKGATS
ncbi:MAG: hypothetical protein M3167_04450 [Acidobacteriota bacterium]|nr:hypothetical protein [Acidobacteriota bacterium]